MSDEQQQAKNEFTIQKIYIKDVSFETPNSPQVFQQEWKPEVNFELSSDTQPLEGDVFEVVLRITVTAKIKDDVAFLVEVHQAGIFTLKNFDEQEKQYVFGSVCPSVLFPYAREMISSAVARGGFPQLNLAPINFDAVYAQHANQQKAEAAGEQTVN